METVAFCLILSYLLGNILHVYSLKKKFSLGITLIELLLVTGIIATLTSIAVPTYSGYRDKVNNAEATAQITGIELIIDRFYAENGRGPHNLAEVGKGGLLDPWGNTYEYLDIVNAGPGDQPRKWGPIHPINTDYDLYSKGKDGKSKAPLTAAFSRDDIVRARDGQYVGLVSDI